MNITELLTNVYSLDRIRKYQVRYTIEEDKMNEEDVNSMLLKDPSVKERFRNWSNKNTYHFYVIFKYSVGQGSLWIKHK